jgi:hypothetical protein
MLTPDQVQELQRLCEAATEGEWRVFGISGVTSPEFDIVWEGAVGQDEDGTPINVLGCHSPEDAAFIAASRTALPSALATIEELRAENERLRRICKKAFSEGQDRKRNWEESSSKKALSALSPTTEGGAGNG